ncbi:hypothetical protein Sjap_000975 [Stephania japonica]|uniref:Alfin N-terminal domain-containing protein n=1 Tax=Stephania japonica TaxID=461633 RepID=A0AAP0KLM6_9MAGN
MIIRALTTEKDWIQLVGHTNGTWGVNKWPPKVPSEVADPIPWMDFDKNKWLVQAAICCDSMLIYTAYYDGYNFGQNASCVFYNGVVGEGILGFVICYSFMIYTIDKNALEEF